MSDVDQHLKKTPNILLKQTLRRCSGHLTIICEY